MRWLSLTALFVLLWSSPSAAEVMVELDGQPVAGFVSLSYDAGSQRLSLQLATGAPCQGMVIDPMSGQLGLQLGNEVHAVSGPIAYDADPLLPVVRIETQLGTLVCPGPTIFSDRFQLPG